MPQQQSKENEKSIITFSLSQKTFITLVIGMITIFSGGSFYYNWQIQKDVEVIKAIIPINQRDFNDQLTEVKNRIDSNDKKDAKDHKDLFQRLGDLEFNAGIRRRNNSAD